MKDYSKGKIYKIVCNKTGLIYIGSTCEPTLARRLATHVGDYRRWINGKHNFITSFKIIEGGSYDIILVEESPCESKDQLHARERRYIETIECVNKVIPTRSMKEYTKEYYENNKEKIQEYRGQKIICSCGGKYTICHKSCHEKSKRHQDYVNSQEI
jgi:hypothetical protein